MPELRASWRMFLFLLNVVWVIPVQTCVLLLTRGDLSYIIPRLWHDLCRRIFGIHVHVTGRPHRGEATLYVANHISYLDIVALGAIIPQSSFIAKEDVETWAGFGYLSRLQQTIFISRKPGKAKSVAEMIDPFLKKGRSLILFPEGTSTDGRNVYPFKSSLFTLCAADPAKGFTRVQPITIKVLAVDGKEPQTQDERDIYSWHVAMDPDLTLLAHLWNFARYRRTDLGVVFHEPVAVTEDSDRKTLAQDAWNAVSLGLSSNDNPPTNQRIAA